MAGNNTAVATLPEDQREWLEWANYHRNLFGWGGPNDAPMLATWIGFFKRSGYQATELQQATDQIARHTEKTYKREDHLAMLQTHLYSLRQQNILRQPVHATENDQRGTCVHCGETGAVSVPLLRDVAQGTWTTRRTCAVWCTCWAGRQFHATRNARGEAMMGLTEYTHRNPLWRRQVETARTLDAEADLLRTEAVEAAGSAKSNFDLLRDRVMVRWGMLSKEAPARPSMPGDGAKKGIDHTAARDAFERAGPWQKEQRSSTSWDKEFSRNGRPPKQGQTNPKKGN